MDPAAVHPVLRLCPERGQSTARFPIVLAPKDFLASRSIPSKSPTLVDLALGPPSGRVPDIGGPEVSTWAEMVRQYLRAIGRRRPVIQVLMPGTRAIRAGGLLVKEPAGKPGAHTWRSSLPRSSAEY